MKLLKPSIAIAFFLIVLALSLSNAPIHLFTEICWFDAVGFTQVLWTRLTWQILIGLLTFIVYSLFLWGNYRRAIKSRPVNNLRLIINNNWEATL